MFKISTWIRACQYISYHWLSHPFKGPRVVMNGVFLHLQLELSALGFSSVPKDKILKDWGKANMGLYLENSVFADIYFYTFFNYYYYYYYYYLVGRTNSCNLSRHFRYILYLNVIRNMYKQIWHYAVPNSWIQWTFCCTPGFIFSKSVITNFCRNSTYGFQQYYINDQLEWCFL